MVDRRLKRWTLVALAVGLVCTLLAGSALAFAPAFLSAVPTSARLLRDDVSSREVRFSGDVSYKGRFTTSADWKTWDAFTGFQPSYSFNLPAYQYGGNSWSAAQSFWYLFTPVDGSTTNKYHRLSISAGSFFDVDASVFYSSDLFTSVSVAGSGAFQLYYRDGLNVNFPSSSSGSVNEHSLDLMPTSVGLVVNGQLVSGSVVSFSGPSFSLPTVQLDLSDWGEVYSIGYRFYFNAKQTAFWSNTSGNSQYLSFYLYFADNGLISTAGSGDPLYKSSLDLLLASMQQQTASVDSIKTLIDKLSDSLSGLGSLSTSLDKLVSVFAREDDIQLRNDADSALKSFTSIFYPSEDDMDSPNAIGSEQVSQIGDTLSGAGALFDSGYSVNDAFTDIADNKDDYLSWFSEDVASWLDSVPASVSDPSDPDPFNHHYLEEQYQKIKDARRRGDR